MASRNLSGITTVYLEDGGDRRDRTDDLKLAKLPLYQLSYVPPTSLPADANDAAGWRYNEWLASRSFVEAKDGGPGKT
jgi:hypothetical protein